jgi:hypothetical protein
MRGFVLIFFSFIIISCDDNSKDTEPPVIADFSYEIDVSDFLKVHFTNLSENAISVSWDFGNGEESNLENPICTYTNMGEYDVTLTVFGKNGVEVSKSLTITLAGFDDPISILYGNQSKTWKLYRVGSAVSLGPNSSQPDLWWEGFYNDGSRSCLYKHEFIFKNDGTFEFVDYKVFWGDHMIWPSEDPVYNTCFEPSADNMVVDDTDLTPWLSGVHNFEFCSSNCIILRGKGAWIGFPYLGTSSNHGTNLPDSVAFTVNFEQMLSYDLMTVYFDHGEDGFWTFRYVSYQNWQDEPPLIE